MATIETLPWDPAQHLETGEDIVAYLEAAREDGDPALMSDVLDVIERALGERTVTDQWSGSDDALGAYLREESNKSLESYRNQPNNLREDANIEEDTARGGYAERQLFELVQNSADALSESEGEHIWIKLTPDHLYCADNGKPIDEDGARTLLFSHLSSKRGTAEIGRFGLGFKSVLGVTDTPEFFSRSGSFRFDRERSAELLSPIAPDIERYPVLRLAEPIDPRLEIQADPNLREMAYWAQNIVRLPLRSGAHQTLERQMKEFPGEFLLFVEHVGCLVLETHNQQAARIVALTHEGDRRNLDDGGRITQWAIGKRIHQLSSDAKSDRRTLDDSDEVPIWWAVPVNRLNEPGKFWAFFPTNTESLLAGILNAPWKTNEDRQNLLQGPYNDELIEAAAGLVADMLVHLSTPEDPARHLDALPRRSEAGDAPHSDRLRSRLYSVLQNRPVVPDQDGRLRPAADLACSPLEPTSDFQPALERWASYGNRPKDWVHHRALTRNRLARLERLHTYQMPKATIRQWLEALVGDPRSHHTAYSGGAQASARINHMLSTGKDIGEDEAKELAVEASKAAIQTAALIPAVSRGRSENLGRIILASDGHWLVPDPDATRLRGETISGTGMFVHERLELDHETLKAMEELGIRPGSPSTAFKDLASTLLNNPSAVRQDSQWNEFWQLSKDLNQSTSADIVRAHNRWREALRFRTIAGSWRPLFNTLLPGRIVPSDGSRDESIAIDTEFHAANLELISLLGVKDIPQAKHPLSARHDRSFLSDCRRKFTDRELQRQPRSGLLNFKTTNTTGPLDVLEELSDEGNALYTWELMSIPDTYDPWIMSHDTQSLYGTVNFPSPALETLLQYGRVKTDEGVAELSDGVSDPPRSHAVLERLLSHPRADSIRHAFRLIGEIQSPLELIGEEPPIPLADVWPLLTPHIPMRHVNLELIRCDGIYESDMASGHDEQDCIIRNGSIYILRKADERDELRSIMQGLGIQLSAEQVDRILLGLADTRVMAAREEVRNSSTDTQRLLVAVGETRLRNELPGGLLRILEDEQTEPLTGEQVAEAAITMFHTAALRQCRGALGHLDPPKKWAGTRRAVEFVQSLGFSAEWAGEPNIPREPYIEVRGPYSLPQLHEYQSRIVNNVRSFIKHGGTAGERRGMISMPTGSGKTRVAIQAIVEAIREDGFEGGVLWIADRDELCEQAVEGWQQVWSSEGTQSTNLRISRMWGGQPRPLPTADRHVIVATIQTLSARIDADTESYQFLRGFKLVVLDEAHRSVAPSFTSVMQELGLTRYTRPFEPILIGLTATPYRGSDETETQRLVNRYASNRLDAGAFTSDSPEGIFEELQHLGVLAQTDHATIEGGHFILSDDELHQAQETPWLPRSVENRIAEDSYRTRRIIDAYEHHVDPEWPTLIFATSVEHAHTVSALLNSMNVDSRAVSSSTEASVRRHVVEQFRHGGVKALVNYGVFREGFDAPNTRAILVARPVYSPNLYFQMIGRGLRGVKNGGNDRCLIMNVSDNIENFERKPVFSELDWLWDR